MVFCDREVDEKLQGIGGSNSDQGVRGGNTILRKKQNTDKFRFPSL